MRETALVLAGLANPATLGSLLLFLALYRLVALGGLAHISGAARDRIAPFLGWKFAIGFVISIYVHEMGHVSALRRYGIRAGPPIFLPGFGAIVRLHQRPAVGREDARIGLRGPVWGLATAIAAYGAFLVTGAPAWSALAQASGFLNLFNLIPVWQLDGARAFRALSSRGRWTVVAIAVVLCVASALRGAQFLGQPLLPVLLVAFALLAALRALRTPLPAAPDNRAAVILVGLLIALTAVAAA